MGNKFNVGDNRWKLWDAGSQRVFNSTYQIMMKDQDLFSHRSAEHVLKEHWETTCWNAAKWAADAAQVEIIALKEQVGPT